jgi:hypothetical protein
MLRPAAQPPPAAAVTTTRPMAKVVFLRMVSDPSRTACSPLSYPGHLPVSEPVSPSLIVVTKVKYLSSWTSTCEESALVTSTS